MDKKTRLLISIASIVILVLGTVIGVLLVQGYTVDPKEKKIIQTGVLIINSVPNNARIEIDGHYQDVTNTSISFLPAKKYKLRLTKEGYIPWEKEITIDNKIITEIEAILWPAIPSINPLTTTGAVNLKIAPNGLKIAYGVRYHERDKAGLWVLDMAKKTIFSGIQQDLIQIARNTNALNFADAQYVWSPDSTQILITLQENKSPEPSAERNYLLNTTQLNTNPIDITLTKEGVLQTWYEELKTRETAKLLKLENDPIGKKIATESAIPIRWSWDNTMFLYAEATTKQTQESLPKIIKLTNDKSKYATDSARAHANEHATSSAILYRQAIESQTASLSADLKIKVYDIKKQKSYKLPHADYYMWYPAEEKADRVIQHLIMVENGKVSMIESDGMNKSTIYSAPFEPNSVFPWPDGGRLVFLTNFNSGAGIESNLYTINLR